MSTELPSPSPLSFHPPLNHLLHHSHTTHNTKIPTCITTVQKRSVFLEGCPPYQTLTHPPSGSCHTQESVYLSSPPLQNTKNTTPKYRILQTTHHPRIYKQTNKKTNKQTNKHHKHPRSARRNTIVPPFHPPKQKQQHNLHIPCFSPLFAFPPRTPPPSPRTFTPSPGFPPDIRKPLLFYLFIFFLHPRWVPFLLLLPMIHDLSSCFIPAPLSRGARALSPFTTFYPPPFPVLQSFF